MKRLVGVMALLLAAACGGKTVTRTIEVGGHKLESTSAAAAGAAATFTLTALDGSGAANTGYRGTVHFTSDDARAVLPANVTFGAGDQGRVSVSATFKTS
jgi:hypothetical protein